MLIEKAKQQLGKAGWYEGRKIDISEQIEFLESLGYEVFDAAREFMERYGELDITDKSYTEYKGDKYHIHEEHHTTCIKDILWENMRYNLDEEVGKKTIPVFVYYDEVYIYIRGWKILC